MSSNKLTLAQVNWSNEGVPLSEQFDDIYFSVDDGLAEVQHNFIDGNRLTDRFSMVETSQVFRIAETGFGSGLNFLMAAELWLSSTPESAQLHFISFEKHPMSLQDLKQAHQRLPDKRVLLLELAQQLQNNYPLLLPGWHDVWLADKRIRLTLWLGDVLKGLPECDASDCAKVDAWFLDGFAPSKNPDMWQPGLFQQMGRLSHLETTFATFTAAGVVRRGLAKAGFKVEKGPGFGRKREMCFGQLEQLRPYSSKAPWYSRPDPIVKPLATTSVHNAIVIGAGLAGAAMANQLAQAGWQVTVLEAEEQIATQASGNLAGAVHPLVTADWNLRSQWYLQGFEATLRTVLPWLNRAPEMGDLSGLVQLSVSDTSKKRVSDAFQRVGLPSEFIEPLSTEAAADILGTSVTAPGVLFPQGGWLYPKAVIEKCLSHSEITLHCQQRVAVIEATSNDEQQAWQIKTQDQIYHADVVVVATGSLDSHLNQQLGLPIRPVKGQVSHLSDAQQTVALKKAVTHEGYSVSHSGGAVTGATFEAPDMSQSLSLESHQHNLELTNAALPEWLDVGADELGGRVAFRPTTPDHLPIIGAVANPDWVEQAYLSQSHTHAVYRYPQQQYQKGLYVSNGHGPRGLMSVFLAAEVIMADINGDVLPQPLSLYQANHPARFQIRQWRSGQKMA